MTQGFAYLPDTGTPVKWLDGELGFWKSLASSLRMEATDLAARRCSECGYVEFYVDTQAKPVKNPEVDRRRE